ncbi:HupE/UreJ family protein [Ensifer aridi]|uniref:HupE/UreJ family protein n=1 Tax=Ensifer aridi TaxID=1708715 RepID=UPI000A10426D|nr:HupE/UreJ family protein [Ensifer aridi]
MGRRVPTAIAATAAFTAAAPARAHAPLDGVGDFYAGLLHPLIVPVELLAVASVGLLLGFCGLRHCRVGIPAFGCGLIAGLAMGSFGADGIGSGLLLGAALAAAVTVTVGVRMTVAAAASVAVIGGVAIGLDARPDPQSFPAALVAGIATVVSGTVVALVVAALVLSRQKFWQDVAVRVAGSWITASGVLYFTWQLVGRSG